MWVLLMFNSIQWHSLMTLFEEKETLNIGSYQRLHCITRSVLCIIRIPSDLQTLPWIRYQFFWYCIKDIQLLQF